MFAIPAFFTIDKLGRRGLLLATFPFMACFQLAVGLAHLTDYDVQKVLVPVFVYLFAVIYSVGEGPVPFVGFGARV